jgi:UDP-GlcNAc:undecaprenyl-phosphate/decaprenyl-phosphate GlcNAc-1-phosphate transferase
MLKYWVLGLTAAGLALLLTPLTAALARWVGAVDEPEQRRVHTGRIPRLGGLAVFAAFVGAIGLGLLADRLFLDVFWGNKWPWGWLLGGALVVVACGAADDVWTLGPLPKLCFQIVAGTMVLAAGRGITLITNPLTGMSTELGLLAVPLTILWVVGITNAFNLIDGLDGLAVGVALIASGTLFLVSLAGGRVEVALLAAALAGALAGFLYYNFNPASVFLGDCGSLLVGYLLSVLSIQASQKGATAVVILVPILALGLPIMDALLAMIRRLLRALRVVRPDDERNEYRFLVVGPAALFRADRDHIHHRLLALGLTHRRAVFLLYAVCIGLGVLAFLAVSVRGANTAVMVGLVGIASYVGVRKLGYREVEVLRRGTLLPLFELPVFSRRLFHACVDAGFVATAYAAALLATSPGAWDHGVRDYLLGTMIVFVTLKLGVFVALGLYQRSYRYTGVTDMIALLKAVVVAELAAVAVVAVLYGLPHRALPALLLDWYFTATLVIGARVSFKLLEAMAQAHGEAAASPVLIYGSGAGGTALLREIEQNPKLGYRAVGFVDDSLALRGRSINGVPVLGGVEDLYELIPRHGVREVIVSTPNVHPEHMDRVATACRLGGVQLRRFRIALEEVAPSPALAQDWDEPPGREVGAGVG